MSTKGSLASRRVAGLDGAAIVVERIGYSNGDGTSINSPRINTDGAMPTIW